MRTRAPDPLAVRAAIDTLMAAGFSLQAPAHHRLQLVSLERFAEMAGWKDTDTARRAVLAYFPRRVRLPGGDLRVYLRDVEAFFAAREVSRKEAA
jgi:hypothetical protein